MWSLHLQRCTWQTYGACKPLHYIIKALGTDLKDIKKQDAVRLPPDWRCPVLITFDSNADKAVDRDGGTRWT